MRIDQYLILLSKYVERKMCQKNNNTVQVYVYKYSKTNTFHSILILHFQKVRCINYSWHGPGDKTVTQLRLIAQVLGNNAWRLMCRMENLICQWSCIITACQGISEHMIGTFNKLQIPNVLSLPPLHFSMILLYSTNTKTRDGAHLIVL